MPCLPDKNKEEGDSGTVAGGQTFQFCVRDNPTGIPIHLTHIWLRSYPVIALMYCNG